MYTLHHRQHRNSAPFSDRQKRIYDFLHQQHIGVLSSVTPDGNPHGVVVYYVVDEQLTVWILTKTGTRKYENLTHNDHVMLTVYEPRTQATVQVTGVAVERPSRSDINRTARAIFDATLRTSDTGLPPIVKLQAGTFTTFQISPLQIRMAVYARPDPGGYEELFESVESFDIRNEI